MCVGESIAMRLACCLALAFAAYGPDVNASSDLHEFSNGVFERLHTTDGLSHGQVVAIHQDGAGFMWFGTHEGLNRYDGNSFRSYYASKTEPASLSNDVIWDLVEAPGGGMWVATNHGLNKYRPASDDFESFRLDDEYRFGATHERIYTLFVDSAGALWVGTGEGLARWLGDDRFEHHHHDENDPHSIAAGAVRSIVESEDGSMWVGIQEGGISRLDRTSNRFERYSHVPSNPQSLSDNFVRVLVEYESKIWAGTYDGGVSILDPASGTFERLLPDALDPRGISSSRVRALYVDPAGKLWLGTDGGLQLYQQETGTFRRFVFDVANPRSLSDDIVYDILEDRGGVLWVATFGGISKWNRGVVSFASFSPDNNLGKGLVGAAIMAFTEDDRGDVWIGTLTGVSKWDSSSRRFRTVVRSSGLGNDRYMSLENDDGVIWAGTMSDGVHLINDEGVFDSFRHDASDPKSLAHNGVSSVLKDSQGRIWVGTYGGGFHLYLGDREFKRFPDPDTGVIPRNDTGPFSALTVVKLHEGKPGEIWVAAGHSGVGRFDPSTEKMHWLRGELDGPIDYAVSILRTSDALWVGSYDQGATRFELISGNVTSFGKNEGLASDAVYGILEDDSGHVWLSGGKGLSVYDTNTMAFDRFDESHGLQSNDFNSGAYYKLTDGTLLFGGNNGFNAFNPDTVRRNEYVPEVRVTAISKLNEQVFFKEPAYALDRFELEHSDYVVGFEFAALDYTSPKDNLYRYKLEGLHDDWVDAGRSRQASFTNLSAGDYTFRVQGSNSDGVWNREGASIDILVHPPFWATWWAYLIYGIVGLFVLWQMYMYNTHRLRREAERKYNSRLQLYIESLEEATDCVLIADASQKMLYANNAIKDIMGMEPLGAVGKPMLELIFSSAADRSAVMAGLQGANRWKGEVNNVRGSENYTAEVTVSDVRDVNGLVTAYVSILRDVTSRKRTEAELDNHRRNLEFLVEERTKALSREIAENKLTQKDLARSLEEKELLLKEVHHRVKNNMQVISSLLNIQGETVEDEHFLSLLNESQQRIKSMSLIHESLYQSESLLEIDFDDYINMLANSLCRSYSVPGVSVYLDVNVDDLSLDIETAVPCGLIINELISNSLKHAFSEMEGTGIIRVSFSRQDGSYILKIQDNGKGLPESFDINNPTSMGLEIISILTQQLDGEICAQNEEGASFVITFPGVEKNAA